MNNIELTFDEFVAALVTIQLKRKMSNHTLQDIKDLLEIEYNDIDMGNVCSWLEENDLATINYSKFGEGFLFAMDGIEKRLLKKQKRLLKAARLIGNLSAGSKLKAEIWRLSLLIAEKKKRSINCFLLQKAA